MINWINNTIIQQTKSSETCVILGVELNQMPKIKEILKIFRWEFCVNTIGKSSLVHPKLRYFIYKFSKLNTRSADISSGVTFTGDKVEIEEGAFINRNVFIDSKERVVIGENTAIAFNVSIYTSTHDIGLETYRAGKPKRIPTIIGKGCWIGANTIILPGVIIGDGCIIAAGSVVKGNCVPNGLYAGVPAKRIRELPLDTGKLEIV